MQEIMLKAQELVSVATQRVKELDGLIAKNRAETEQHESEAKRLNEVKQDLSRREVSVSKIEDVMRYRNETISVRDKADKAMETYKREKDTFDRASEAKTAQIISDEKAIRQEWESIKDARKKIEEGQKKLDEDRVKIKEAMKKLGI